MHEIFDLDGTSVARVRIRDNGVPELLIMTPAIEDEEGSVTPAASYSFTGWDTLNTLHEALIRLHEAKLLENEGSE